MSNNSDGNKAACASLAFIAGATFFLGYVAATWERWRTKKSEERA